MQTVDEYLVSITPVQKAEFERIRKIVKKAVPDTVEVISYGIPTFKYKGKFLLYFGAFKNHMSLFPGPTTEAMKDKLKDFKLGKGTIQFTSDKPVPEPIIKELLINRVAVIDGQ